ncbi:MAG: GNAT family N-acetyltransferase [Prochloraceae cyanobacterium]
MEKIVTDRIQLSPLLTENVPEIYRIWTLPEVRKYLWDDRIVSFQETKEIVARSIKAFDRQEYGLWLAKLKEDLTVIGFCGYWPFFEPPQIQLIYGLDPNYWQQGLATEMARAMIKYGFDRYKFASIYAACDADNLASIALMKRIDMEFDKREEEVIFYRKIKLAGIEN